MFRFLHLLLPISLSFVHSFLYFYFLYHSNRVPYIKINKYQHNVK
jgi:hypothetical protein